jgi:hypothetical protein
MACNVMMPLRMPTEIHVRSAIGSKAPAKSERPEAVMNAVLIVADAKPGKPYTFRAGVR